MQVKRGELGVATGIFFTLMSVGGAVGVAISGESLCPFASCMDGLIALLLSFIGAVWNNTLPEALVERLPAGSSALATRICKPFMIAYSLFVLINIHVPQLEAWWWLSPMMRIPQSGPQLSIRTAIRRKVS